MQTEYIFVILSCIRTKSEVSCDEKKKKKKKKWFKFPSSYSTDPSYAGLFCCRSSLFVRLWFNM